VPLDRLVPERCLIAEVEATGEIRVVRVSAPDPALSASVWSCNHCAHELPPESRLALEFDGMELRDCA